MKMLYTQPLRIKRGRIRLLNIIGEKEEAKRE